MGRPRGAGVERRAVSVIIPTNRGGPYLAEAVASLRAQTAAPDEVILVDDGSPSPGLAAIARELGVDYVRKDAGGISSARNAGVARARGTWVAFLDDDDLWHPDRLRAQLSALDGDPDAIASFTGGEYIDAAGRPHRGNVEREGAGRADRAAPRRARRATSSRRGGGRMPGLAIGPARRR